MKLAINREILGLRMAERGLDGESLALLADVSPSTITSIFRGKPCHLRVGTAIAAALQSVPVLEGMAELLLSNQDEQTEVAP